MPCVATQAVEELMYRLAEKATQKRGDRMYSCTRSQCRAVRHLATLNWTEKRHP